MCPCYLIFQINEVLKLLNELLPTITAEEDSQQKTDKEAFLINHPDILHKFGVDLLPILIQVGICHVLLELLVVSISSPVCYLSFSPSSRWSILV